MAAFVTNCLVKMTGGCFSDSLLLWLCYQHFWSSSEDRSDQKDYHKRSSCVIVCWIATSYQSITLKKGWLLGHLQRTYEPAEIAQKKDQ